MSGGYRELPPPAALAPWVACGWVATRASGHVLPDGCADVVWTGERLIVAGPATRASVSTDAPEAAKIGVRFRIGAAGAALGLPASALLDANPEAGLVVPGGDALAERVAACASPDEALAELTRGVAYGLRDAPAPDGLVRAAVAALARPRSRVAELAAGLGVSERQLRRRFGATVGYGPKTLQRVLRLQRLLHLAHESAAVDQLARLAADAGYADQAHLARDCRDLTGVAPNVLIADGRVPAGERALVA